jgi:hypothetical protein
MKLVTEKQRKFEEMREEEKEEDESVVDQKILDDRARRSSTRSYTTNSSVLTSSVSSPLRRGSTVNNLSSLISNNPRSIKDVQEALARLDVIGGDKRRSSITSESPSSSSSLNSLVKCAVPLTAAAETATTTTHENHAFDTLATESSIQRKASLENLAPCWNNNQRTRHLSFKLAVSAVKAANRFSST